VKNRNTAKIATTAAPTVMATRNHSRLGSGGGGGVSAGSASGGRTRGNGVVGAS
jgi:hypothetical protein